MCFYIYSARWTRSSCLEIRRSAKTTLLAFPTDASPVVELHHGPGMAFYSSHLRLLNTPVVLSAWRDLGLPRRKLHFQVSCRPASGLWGINFIVFSPFLCALRCWSLKWGCLASGEKREDPEILSTLPAIYSIIFQSPKPITFFGTRRIFSACQAEHQKLPETSKLGS